MPNEVYVDFLNDEYKRIRDSKRRGEYTIDRFAQDCGIDRDEMYQIRSKKRGGGEFIKENRTFPEVP